MSLLELVDNTRCDKNSVHSYLETYENLFSKFKYSAKNVLEIGPLSNVNGGGIKLWYDYFENAVVYGLDKDNYNNVWSELKSKQRIKLYTSYDAYDDKLFKNNLSEKKFDILIDDGPHTLESMIYFVNKYSSLLSEEGVLVVEDVQKYEWIETLKNFVPDELQKYIEVYDVRHIKQRYDDILFVINKKK